MAAVILVGILNVTPDSFSDGGKFINPTDALEQADRLIKQGASIIDVGAEATNPFVEPIAAREEIQRLETILPDLVEKFPGRISVDTHHPETAEYALGLGRVIINDVTTFRNPALVEVVVRYQARVIASHMPLAAQTIKQAHADESIRVDSIYTVRDELLQQINLLVSAGLVAKNIIADPGIGFGKTMRTNYNLLKFAELLPDVPVLIGHSRKRFIAEYMGAADKADLATNQRAARIAVRAGARYLRVHDPENYLSLISSGQP